jgi:hypothetical protein
MQRTVWMIHKFTEARTGVKGQLVLEGKSLRFFPDAGEQEVVLNVENVRKVGRGLRSPVLRLRVKAPGLPPEVFFYFVEPPFLYGKQAKFTLTVADTYLHDEISEWVEAIQTGQSPERSGR